MVYMREGNNLQSVSGNKDVCADLTIFLNMRNKRGALKTFGNQTAEFTKEFEYWISKRIITFGEKIKKERKGKLMMEWYGPKKWQV